MKTRSHTTRSKQPMIGISNLCLTHDDANDKDPFNLPGPTLSRFAGVTDSIGDPSDDETDDNGTDANDNGTDADGNATDYYDNDDDNYFANM